MLYSKHRNISESLVKCVLSTNTLPKLFGVFCGFSNKLESCMVLQENATGFCLPVY